MKISITWANRYPVQESDKYKTEWENVPDGDGFNFAEIEKQAILDAPVGHYLSAIELPR